MASLLSSRSLALSRSGRSHVQEQSCSISQIVISQAARRVAGPSMAPVPFAQQSQRSIAGPVTRGIPVSGPGAASSSGGVAGQVTSELMDSMRSKICEALETDSCAVTDVYGDGRHVSIDVVSKLFVDKNSMQRQRMVYKAIWLELQEAVHAVDSMSTKTPEEVAK